MLFFLALAVVTAFPAVAGARLRHTVCQVPPPAPPPSLSTDLVASSIAPCLGASSSEIIFSSGTYLLGGVLVSGAENAVVRLGPGVTLLGSANESDWLTRPPLPSYPVSGENSSPRNRALFTFENCLNVTLVGGGGVLDGGGASWWHKRSERTPPSAIQTVSSASVNLEGVRVRNSAWWSVHIWDCRDVTITDFDVYASMEGAHTDGFDIDSSSNVLVERTTIETMDDCVAIKSGKGKEGLAFNTPSAQIVFRGLKIKRCGGLAIGSEVAGGVSDVLFDRTHFDGLALGNVVRVKGTSEPSIVQNVEWRDSTVSGVVGQAIFYAAVYEAPALLPVTEFRNLTVNGLSAVAGEAASLKTLKGAIADFNLQNVKITAPIGYTCKGNGAVNFTVSGTVQPKPISNCKS